LRRGLADQHEETQRQARSGKKHRTE
jgi:hypothetical protein